MTKTTTATIAAGQLRGMLADALRTAGDDDTLPMLCGVLLHTAAKGDGTVLVATSTDRFMFGQIHVQATGELPETFVTRKGVQRAVTALSLVAEDVLVSLSNVVGAGLRFDCPDMSVTVETRVDVEFPKLMGAIVGTTGNGPEQHVAISYRWLTKIAAIAKSRGNSWGIESAVRFRLQGPTRPVVFEIGDDYHGLVMPMRIGEKQADVPLFIPPAEQAAIDKAAAQSAEAKRQNAAKAEEDARREKRSAAAKKAAATRAARKTGTTPAAKTTRTSRRKVA